MNIVDRKLGTIRMNLILTPTTDPRMSSSEAVCDLKRRHTSTGRAGGGALLPGATKMAQVTTIRINTFILW